MALKRELKMPKLNDLKTDLHALYMSTFKSTDRFNIIHEMEQLLKELREIGAELAMNPPTIDESSFIGIRNIILDQAGRLADYGNPELVKGTDRINEVAEKLNLDSLDTIEIVMQIEESYDIEFNDYELDSIFTSNCTIDELANFIKNHH